MAPGPFPFSERRRRLRVIPRRCVCRVPLRRRVLRLGLPAQVLTARGAHPVTRDGIVLPAALAWWIQDAHSQSSVGDWRAASGGSPAAVGIASF
jgi:hypothetical protein